MFIQQALLYRMVFAIDRGQEDQHFGMLWLAAYVFLLRVPSEALPMCRGGDGFDPVVPEQSLLYMENDDTLCLRLHTRKNQLRGSVLKRSCTCANSKGPAPANGFGCLCPIH